jgi:hypothetical protein
MSTVRVRSPAPAVAVVEQIADVTASIQTGLAVRVFGALISEPAAAARSFESALAKQVFGVL